MTSTQQRSELQSQIWKIANEVRGSVDGWDFAYYSRYSEEPNHCLCFLLDLGLIK